MNRIGWLALSSMVICAFVGTAAAQGGGTTGATGTVAASSPPVSAKDQLAAVQQAVDRVKASSSRVRHMLDEARRAKDVIKTTCLSDKLAQLEVTLKSVRDRQASLQSAISRADDQLRNHEFSVVNVLRQRGEQLDAEANQCVGEELGFPGETRLTYKVDPNIAPVDPGLPSSTDTTGTWSGGQVIPPFMEPPVTASAVEPSP